MVMNHSISKSSYLSVHPGEHQLSRSCEVISWRSTEIWECSDEPIFPARTVRISNSIDPDRTLRIRAPRIYVELF